jgi:hypothetical protein
MNSSHEVLKNGNSHAGSSETIRKTTEHFHFSAFLKSLDTPHKVGLGFLEWFVGFSEGDGSFLVDEKRGRLFFVITQKDPKLLYAIRKGLSFGSVTTPPSAKGIWRFCVSDQKGVDRLIH